MYKRQRNVRHQRTKSIPTVYVTANIDFIQLEISFLFMFCGHCGSLDGWSELGVVQGIFLTDLCTLLPPDPFPEPTHCAVTYKVTELKKN